jgi:peptidyl-prolyl cis-trans isomerase D
MNTKWIMVVVAVCFVGMMIFAWGMDITGMRSGVEAGIVGKVNGEEIPYTYYDNMVKMQREQYTTGSERLTLFQERNIHEEAWNSIVAQMVVSQDIKRRKITYSDQELIVFMKNNPPQFAYNPQFAELFFENDQFSIIKYQSFINPANLRDPQMGQILQYIEAEASGRLPALKFQESLMNSVVVTESMIRERWLMDNEKRKADWFFMAANTVLDVGTTLESGEIQAYYDAHRDDYKRGSRRSVAAVVFPLAPSVSDTTNVLDLAQTIVQRARDGADFSELANEYSDDPGNIDRSGNRMGGELGFFGRGRMVPEFEEAAFGMQPGDVSDPVLSRFGYHIIKVDSLVVSDEDKTVIDQVGARHILLNIEPSGDTRDAVESKVVSFRESVEKGTDFLIQAQLDNLTVQRSRPFEADANTVQGIPGSTKMLVNRVFAAKKGDLLPVFSSENGYYVMFVEDILSAGVPPLEEISTEVEAGLRAQKRAEFAADVTRRIAARVDAGKSLKEAVEEDEYKSIQMHEGAEVYRNLYVNGIGTMNAFVAEIFKLDNPNSSTGAVVLDEGAGMAVMLEKLPIDEVQYEQDREQVRNRLVSELQNDVVQRYIDGLMEKAKIVDNRFMFVGL